MSAFQQALKDNKHNWDLNTQAGQNLYGAFLQVAEGINAYYEPLEKAQPANEALIRSQLKSEKALYAQAKAAGATTDQLKPLLDSIHRLEDQLAKLKSKTITVTLKVNTKYGGGGGSPFPIAKGGVVGIPKADKGAVAGVLPPRSPGTLMLAGEPETGGEVFMPLRGISQRRAMTLAQVAGDAHGFDVTPRAARSAAAIANGAPGYARLPPIVVENHLYLNGKQMHGALIQEAQRYKLRTGTTGLT
jgi:hypothetical protein